MFDFREAFVSKVAEWSPDFTVVGIVTSQGRVYPIGTDTKVLATAFELVVQPFIVQIASEHGYKVFEPASQNFYPDFTLAKSFHAESA